MVKWLIHEFTHCFVNRKYAELWKQTINDAVCSIYIYSECCCPQLNNDAKILGKMKRYLYEYMFIITLIYNYIVYKII